MSGFASIFILLLVLGAIKSILGRGKQGMRRGPIQDDDMVENNGPRAGYGSTYNPFATMKPAAKPQTVIEAPAKPKANKPKNAKKANTQPAPAPAKQKNVTVEPEILKKSKEEVNEDFDYDIIRQAADKHDNCIEGHYEESADFMKTVQDLMVMGPNCSMSYERDFISEGEKMLSGYVGDKESA